VYFILILYSYAAHLRSSTYHALPLTSHPTTEDDLQAEMEHAELDEGAANGDAGKGNVLVGEQGKKGQEAREGEEEFSWD